MSDGVGKIKYRIEIPSEDDVNVVIEGTNKELIRYLKIYIVSIMKSYLYNGIPENLKYAIKNDNIKVKIEGDNK